MKKVVTTVMVLAAFFIVWEKEAPACSEPITYAIGAFDRRFDISQKDFLSALREAEAIWESASGRDLFTYSPLEYRLPINLIYDYRQAATKELVQIESRVEESESTYRMLEEKLEDLKGEYESLKGVYEARLGELNVRNRAYEASVERWNAGSRNSKKEFDELERERESLNAEIDALKVLEVNLNRKVEEINALVDRLNRIARTLNLNVEEYNTIGALRGETFEGGIYYSDGEGEGINIYEFENREKLIRILAHELGHALGLEHLDDQDAIMYHLNHGEARAATASDLAALENLCNPN